MHAISQPICHGLLCLTHAINRCLCCSMLKFQQIYSIAPRQCWPDSFIEEIFRRASLSNRPLAIYLPKANIISDTIALFSLCFSLYNLSLVLPVHTLPSPPYIPLLQLSLAPLPIHHWRSQVIIIIYAQEVVIKSFQWTRRALCPSIVPAPFYCGGFFHCWMCPLLFLVLLGKKSRGTLEW